MNRKKVGRRGGQSKVSGKGIRGPARKKRSPRKKDHQKKLCGERKGRGGKGGGRVFYGNWGRQRRELNLKESPPDKVELDEMGRLGRSTPEMGLKGEGHYEAKKGCGVLTANVLKKKQGTQKGDGVIWSDGCHS